MTDLFTQIPLVVVVIDKPINYTIETQGRATIVLDDEN